MEYYDISRIKAMSPDYAIIVGGRSNGKSHAVARMLLENYAERGEQFVRIVRYIFDMQDKYIEDYFDENNKQWFEETYGLRVWYDSPYYYVAPVGKPGKKDIIGYALALSTEHKYKSNQYDRVTRIVIEEFALMDITRYLTDETDKFLSILSTVVRMRKNVSVWLVGNTISKYNPYFKLLNINIDKLVLKPGDIKIIPQPELGYDEKPKVVIEFAKMAYETAAEIPTILKIGHNDTATTGLYMAPEDVVDSRLVNFNKIVQRYYVQIGRYLFEFCIMPCFVYWQSCKEPHKIDMVVKMMCYDRNRYFWYCMEQLKQSNVIIPSEWYYDSEETKQYVYENIIKPKRGALI